MSTLLVFIGLTLAVTISEPTEINFIINTDVPGPTLVDEFLSITIDAGLASHWGSFDFSSPLVNTLAKGVSPCIFRYGGT